MSLESDAIKVVDAWYAELDKYQDKLPAKGSIAAALHVINRLRANYDLDISHHVAGGEAQITGLSANAIKSILSEFGENRPLSSVGGRSNRGGRGDVAKLLDAMRRLNLNGTTSLQRENVLKAMQRHMVNSYVGLYFSIKRVKATFDPNSSTWRFVQAILANAKANGKAGPVAEYLVGAKLSLRFPDKEIRNKRSSTADAQSGHSGDFEIGNTVFHVTLAPMSELFEKCKANIDRGLRVYILVTDAQMTGARQNAKLLAPGRIAVESIETFIATNIDELSEFDGAKVKSGFRRLLEKYNERVDAVEVDKSMLIEIPPNLE